MQQQWGCGDPNARDVVRDALGVHVQENPDEDPSAKCSNENFRKMHLLENKKSNLSQFASRAMKRIGFSDRKSCIGQAVPDNWCEEAMKAAKDMR